MRKEGQVQKGGEEAGVDRASKKAKCGYIFASFADCFFITSA